MLPTPALANQQPNLDRLSAMKKYNKAPVDSLDLQVVIDVFMQNVMTRCKAAVAAGVANKINALKASKKEMEKKLAITQEKKAVGFFSAIKKSFMVSEIKSQLNNINSQIVDWINSVYRFYFST